MSEGRSNIWGGRPSGREDPFDKSLILRFLAESSRDLNSSLKLDEVYQKIAERVRQLLDYHLFCVMLWNRETGLLEHSYSLCFG